MYKRGFIIFGVVSLTMGNSVLPLAYRFVADIEPCCKLALREPVLFAQLVYGFSEVIVFHFAPRFSFMVLLYIIGSAL